jgi:hypothetical protein
MREFVKDPGRLRELGAVFSPGPPLRHPTKVVISPVRVRVSPSWAK